MFHKRALKKDNQGFTLVELMVVAVIIGILAAIAVPVYDVVKNTANKRAVEANLRTLNGAIMMRASTENVTTAPTIITAPAADTDLVPNYLQAVPTGPTGCSYAISISTPYVATVTFDAANPFGVTIETGPHTLQELQTKNGWGG